MDNRIALRNVYSYANHFKTTVDDAMKARTQEQVAFDRRWPDLPAMGFEASCGGLRTLAQNSGMVWAELAQNVYGASFCNGTGVSRGTAFGKALAELAAGLNPKTIDIFTTKTPPRTYPEIITS